VAFSEGTWTADQGGAGAEELALDKAFFTKWKRVRG
jgi:hypothetical protein